MKIAYLIASILLVVGIFGCVQHFIADIKLTKDDKLSTKFLFVIGDVFFATVGCLMLYLAIQGIIKFW